MSAEPNLVRFVIPSCPGQNRQYALVCVASLMRKKMTQAEAVFGVLAL